MLALCYRDVVLTSSPNQRDVLEKQTCSEEKVDVAGQHVADKTKESNRLIAVPLWIGIGNDRSLPKWRTHDVQNNHARNQNRSPHFGRVVLSVDVLRLVFKVDVLVANVVNLEIRYAAVWLNLKDGF